MIIDAHTHIGKLPNSLYTESHENNLDLILKEAKESGVDALIMIAGMEKVDDRNPTTQSLINSISNHKNVYAVNFSFRRHFSRICLKSKNKILSPYSYR